MLLRNTVSALLLASTLGLNSSPALHAVAGVPSLPAPAQTTEAGGGPGAICLTCVAAGVVGLAMTGLTGLAWTFLIGGAEAVTAGTTIVTCTAACATYFSQE